MQKNQLHGLDVLILAGGLGTRIASRAGFLPKALVPLLGRPFLAWQLDLIRAQGVRSVTYLVSHRAAAIEGFLSDWRDKNPGFTVRTVADPDGEPMGTGRAVREAVLELGGALSDPFFLSYGDSYLGTGWQEAWERYRTAQSSIQGVMTLVAPLTLDTAPNVSWRESRLQLYTKKPQVDERAGLNAVDHGIVLLKKEWVTESFPSTGKYDLSEPLERLSRAGGLGGVFLSEHYEEIGTPAGLDRLTQRLAEQTLVLLDRDGVLNAMVPRATEPSGQDSPLEPSEIQLLPGVLRALERLRFFGVKLALCTNQPAAAKGKVTMEILQTVHAVIEERLALDQWGSGYLGAQICWHRAEDGCGCRKPKAGLLLQALQVYRMQMGRDPVWVWMVGDRVTDLDAGEAFKRVWMDRVQTVGLGGSETWGQRPSSAQIFVDLEDWVSQIFPKIPDPA